ncbi:ABC transporter ATP-binding protein [uncultured Moraxella sp.]|uniref:ABC transporter ATP-binding protein n=1 Tax=uncultured Moraxella sp. TaxID=263769 RepID=UPI0025D7BDDD|nr:ABC transporter ATP-binding protein [uncultured Moraxella sp.]
MEDVVKSYPVKGGRRNVLDGINLKIEYGEKIGILGRNGAGKSTLIRVLGGVEEPTSGSVQRDMSISWPLAFSGAFQGSLTGSDNVRFVCRVYNADYKKAMELVDSFAELGKYLYEPVKVYSSGMRARLAFAISLAVDFDCYLIDEVISVGDASFHRKCEIELFEKRAHKSMIIVSHELHNIKEHCDKVALLHEGKLTIYQDMDEAFAIYNSL